MPSITQNNSQSIRKFLAVSAIGLFSVFSLSACGQVVENARLGRCTNLPSSGGALCEEIGGDYIFVDSLTRTMRRYTAREAQLIVALSSAQAANTARSNGGSANCLANPSIACSGALNNRVSGYRSSGFTSVCSGGQCLSMGR